MVNGQWEKLELFVLQIIDEAVEFALEKMGSLSQLFVILVLEITQPLGQLKESVRLVKRTSGVVQELLVFLLVIPAFSLGDV